MLNNTGTYILLLENTVECRLAVGSLGECRLPPGWFLYVGSAFGPGGIAARVGRHFRRDKKPRWHIDALTLALDLCECWYHHGHDKSECRWNGILATRHDGYPVAGFGSSDCRCPSHLHFFATRPSRSALARRLGVPLATMTGHGNNR